MPLAHATQSEALFEAVPVVCLPAAQAVHAFIPVLSAYLLLAQAVQLDPEPK